VVATQPMRAPQNDPDLQLPRQRENLLQLYALLRPGKVIELYPIGCYITGEGGLWKVNDVRPERLRLAHLPANPFSIGNHISRDGELAGANPELCAQAVSSQTAKTCGHKCSQTDFTQGCIHLRSSTFQASWLLAAEPAGVFPDTQ